MSTYTSSQLFFSSVRCSLAKEILFKAALYLSGVESPIGTHIQLFSSSSRCTYCWNLEFPEIHYWHSWNWHIHYIFIFVFSLRAEWSITFLFFLNSFISPWQMIALNLTVHLMHCHYWLSIWKLSITITIGENSWANPGEKTICLIVFQIYSHFQLYIAQQKYTNKKVSY